MFNLKNIVYLFSLISLILTFVSDQNAKSEYYYYMPLIFGICSVVSGKSFNNLKQSIVFNLFIFQGLIRYCILPFGLAQGNMFKVGYQSNSINIAIFISCVEIIVCFILVNLVSKKNLLSYKKRTFNIIPIKNINFTIILLLIMFLLIYVSGYFAKVNFILNLKTYVEQNSNNQEVAEMGVGAIFFTPFKIILALLLISIIYKTKKIKNSWKKYFYLGIILICSLFIIGTSRFSIILFMLPIFLTISFFLKKSDTKKLKIASIIFMIPVLVITSISKFSKKNKNVSSNEILNTSTISAYIAGVGNVAVGYEVYEENFAFMNSYLFFLNDTFQNVPYFSKFTLNEYKTNIKFNRKIYGRSYQADQIVSLSTSGLMHFGVYGSFVYVVFFLYLAFMMERKSYKTRFIGFRYIYISLSITLSLVFMLNIGSLYYALAANFLFVFLPFLIVERSSKLRNVVN